MAPCRVRCRFAHFHTIPHFLRSKLHRYNKFLFNVNRGFDVGQIAAALPSNLQRDVMFHMHEKLVRSVQLFDVCDENLIKGLVCVLKPQVLLRGDCAFRIHEPGDEMYFIQHGRMQMVDETLTLCYNHLYSGAYFGELSMLTKKPRTATALAASDCVLFYMTADDFHRVTSQHPQVHQLILRKAFERLQRVSVSNKCMARRALQIGRELSKRSNTSKSLELVHACKSFCRRTKERCRHRGPTLAPAFLSSSCTLALTVDQVPPKCRNERSRRWGSRRPDQARRGPLIHRPPQRVWAPTRRCSMPCSAQRRARYRPPPTIQHMT